MNNQLIPDVPSGSHASLNGNPSSLDPLVYAPKMELPSLQFLDPQLDASLTYPSLSPRIPENVSTYSPLTEQTQRDFPAPVNSNLLEAVVHGPHALEKSEGSSSQIQNVTAFEESTSFVDCIITPWEAQTVPYPPLSSIAASGQSLVNRSVIQEIKVVGILPGKIITKSLPCMLVNALQGNRLPIYLIRACLRLRHTGPQIRLGPGGKSLANHCQKPEMLNQTNALRPNVLPDQGFFGWSSQHEEEQNDPREALPALLDEDGDDEPTVDKSIPRV